MKKVFVLAFIALVFAGCEALQFKPEDPIKGAGAITLKFVQMNDVYEIAPLNNGEYGGLARVAHIRDSIKELFPNTFLFLAGDFLSPSVLGSLSVDGKKINGKQMIEVLNAMDLDVATFGNHEFDLTETELGNRINESNFIWTTANVSRVTEKGLIPFSKQLQYSPLPTSDFTTFNAADTDGNNIKFGVFGVTLPSNPKPYVAYGDIYKESKRAYDLAIDKADFVVGLTHVTIDQDKKIASMFMELPLIMGGHEHDNMLERQGKTIIAKADANAKSVYIHTIIYNLRTKNLNVASELMPVTNKIESSAKVDLVVNKWMNILDGLMNDEPLVAEDVSSKEIIQKSDKKLKSNSSKKNISTQKDDLAITAKVPKEKTNINNKNTDITKDQQKSDVIKREEITSKNPELVMSKEENPETAEKIENNSGVEKYKKQEVITSNKNIPVAVEQQLTSKEKTKPTEINSEVATTESKLPITKEEKTRAPEVSNKIETNSENVKQEVVAVQKRIPISGKEKGVSTEINNLEEADSRDRKKSENSLYKLVDPLNGGDKANRSEQTNLGKLIAKSMAFVYNNEVDGAIVNGGSIRIDEELKGDLTRADIYRTLPFGGSVLKVDLMGSLLRKILAFGEEQSGTGAYLQLDNFSETANGYWKNGEKVINDRKIYTVAISDYLLKGLDIPFLNPSNTDIVKIYTPTESENASDIRKAIIFYLNSLKK